MEQARPTGSKFLYISILGFVGAIISIYLTYDHMKDEDGSFCDVGARISCSKVRRSIFSEILNVPISIFGLLFNLVNVYAGYQAKRTNLGQPGVFYLTALFYWNVFGVLFIFYLIAAEIYLQTICPMCTVLHFIQMTTLLLCYLSHKGQRFIPTLFETLWYFRTLIIIIGIINLIPVIIFNTVSFGETNSEITVSDVKINNPQFVDCLKEKGWTFYGKTDCSWCEKQKHLFGNLFEGVNYVNCLVDVDKCTTFAINAFPTWLRFFDGKEIERWKGYATAERLALISDCNAPRM